MDFKGVITFPEFTPGHDWYTYVFKVTDYEGSNTNTHRFKTKNL